MSMAETNPAFTGLEIAIVGMAGRFPGADDVDTFWRHIRDGVESIQHYDDAALQARGVPPSVLGDPDYVKAGAPLQGVDGFDAAFFGYTPREAETLDPQQRVFLECAWASLEHAGCDPARWPGRIGVYAGEGANLYLLRHLLPAFDLGAHSGIAELLALMSGNAGGSLCTRVAYKLNLRGPAVSVQTACSTSLTAVHTACQALLSHDCDMALAGGVWLNLLQDGGYRHQAGAILSADGHCRAFDADATGTVIGSGAGVVVLKRLDEALRDGDTVHAVIKGSAANNDGAAKVGFTAPSVDGQAEVIRAALRVAGVSADTVGYVEAHGTGTTLGDPIEIAALTQAFRGDTARRGYCAVGSVKTNVGHLDAAAGVAGLIKAAMALKHRVLPASLHFRRPNPQIDFAGSPFYVNTVSKPWPADAVPRRAGVSSFGIGGTNVHVVLEEAPAARRGERGREWQVLPLSAQSACALQQAAAQLADHLEAGTDAVLADVAQTLQNGRRAFPVRGVVVADDVALAVQALRAHGSGFDAAPRAPASAPEVAFLFPGGGTQHANMGLALYRDHPVFREEVDRCCEALAGTMGMDLRALLYPAPQGEAEADARLARIEYTQPLLFIVEYAMARLWMSRGIRPAMMLGHSLGEYVAACLAGVFRLEDALRIVAERGRLMQSMQSGAMTAVTLSEAELQPLLATTGCDIAAVNGERLCVLAGPTAAIEAAERQLGDQGLLPRRLLVSIASHSALTDEIVGELQKVVASVPRQAPRMPFISNVTGRPITAQEATDPAYWGRHLRGTVRFADGLAHLLDTPGRVLLEVGPGETLAGLARQHPLAASALGILSSQAHPQQRMHNERHMAATLGALWCAGVAVDWDACHPGRMAHRVPLPSYPFQRQSYWKDAVPASGTGGADGPFYVPVWKRACPVEAVKAIAPASGCTLVIGNADDFALALADHLQRQWPRHPVVRVDLAQALAQLGPCHYAVQAGARADHEAVLRQVQADFGPIAGIHHLGGVDAELPTDREAVLERSFFSLLALAQALEATGLGGERKLPMQVVVNQAEDVCGTEALCPEKATVFSLCKVIGQEYPHLDCRVADVVLPAAGGDAQSWLLEQLAAGMPGGRGEMRIAYRGPHRWTRSYEALAASGAGANGARQRLRRQGVYLITGGLGGVGLAVARHLAQAWQARLVLLGRSALPARSDWERLAADAQQPQALRHKLQQLLEIEALGGEVLALSADVADAAQMHAVAAQARARFGAVQGVIHAAGHAHSGMIGQRTRAMVDAVFAPKLQGTRVLLDALRDEPLDFVLLCSSISSMAGGLGMSDYAAANAYLDAVAALWQRSARYPVMSVNWDAWRDLGMAAGRVLPEGIGMDGPQGARALERIVNGPAFAQVVISTTDLEQRLGELDNGMLALVETGPSVQGKRRNHPRPALSSAYVAPTGDLESGLADLWQDMLGIATVGVDDNLFELGGDSLLAIQILARARKAYEVELHPAAFFKAPTLRGLALLVETRLIEEIENAA